LYLLFSKIFDVYLAQYSYRAEKMQHDKRKFNTYTVARMVFALRSPKLLAIWNWKKTTIY